MRCFHPRDVFVKSVGHSYNVPCGRCLACKKRKQNEWTFRMDAERRLNGWKHCFFVTLTYEDKYITYADDTPVLWKDDLKAFIKRFRRYYPKEKISYFACGEYGDKFDRPHFHLVWYTNQNWSESKSAILHAWSESVPASTPLGSGVFSMDRTYTTKRRSFGRITISAVNMRRIRYCAKYITKDSSKSSELLQEYPKFARMSKGLGKCWLDDKNSVGLCKENLNPVVYTEDGRAVALPRYLSKQVFSSSQAEEIQLMYLRRLPEVSLKLPYVQRVKIWRDIHQREIDLQHKLLKQRSNLFSYGS